MRTRARAAIEESSSGKKTDSVSVSASSAVDSRVSRGLLLAGLDCSPGAMPAGATLEPVNLEKNLNATFSIPPNRVKSSDVVVQHSRYGSVEKTILHRI